MLIEERKPLRENPSLMTNDQLRAELAWQTEQYLRRGGIIESVPVGRSGECESSIRVIMAEKRVKAAKASKLAEKPIKVVKESKISRDPYSMFLDEKNFEVEKEEYRKNKHLYKYIQIKTTGVGFRFEVKLKTLRYNKSAKLLADVVKYRDDFCRENGICLA